MMPEVPMILLVWTVFIGQDADVSECMFFTVLTKRLCFIWAVDVKLEIRPSY